MSLPEVIARFTTGPASLLKLPKGTLKPGADADVTVIDPEREWVFQRGESASKSKNTPFHGWTMKGQVIFTIVGGKVVWREQRELATV
jgi:dihydroorotase